MNVWFTEERSIRREIVDHLRSMRSSRPIKVLDVGGGVNSWLGDLVTDIIDVKPQNVSPGKRVHVGDAHLPQTWNFEPKYFDFISCTHTLEDVRDPAVIVKFMSEYGNAGFIAVPNRHTELSAIEGFSWLGNYHHRWIFNFSQESGFLAVAKWHYLNPLAQSNFLRSTSRLLGGFNPRVAEAVSHIFPRVVFPEYDKRLVANYTEENFPEAGLLWSGSVELSYFNDDWSGLNPKDSARLMSAFLASSPPRNLDRLQSFLDSQIRV